MRSNRSSSARRSFARRRMRLFENLGTALFSNCANLPTVTITAQKSLPATMFGGCCSLSNVVLSGLTSIGAGLFDGCTNLKTIFVPEGVAIDREGRPREQRQHERRLQGFRRARAEAYGHRVREEGARDSGCAGWTDRRRRLYSLAKASFPPCSSSFTFIWMMLLYRGLSRSSV